MSKQKKAPPAPLKEEPKKIKKSKPKVWRSAFNCGLERVNKGEKCTEAQIKLLSDLNLDLSKYVA